MQTVTAVAHTNIALIKYWGKQDADLIIPYNNSLSLTLDRFYTQTSVQLAPKSAVQDEFFLDGQALNGKTLTKMTLFLDIVRKLAHRPEYLIIHSTNHVPTSAGLASSASGLAALALAASQVYGLNLSKKDLSRLARRGSGSACRSIFGGFVEWHKGSNDLTSYAQPLRDDEAVKMDIAMIVLMISKQPKKLSSREGMARTVATSPFYPAFVKSCEVDLGTIKQAISDNNFELLGQISEANALKMHATTLGARPPFSYFLPETLTAIQVVQTIRATGTACYFTMDAGPNIKVICQNSQVERILQALHKQLPNIDAVVAHPGPGVQLVSDETGDRHD